MRQLRRPSLVADVGDMSGVTWQYRQILKDMPMSVSSKSVLKSVASPSSMLAAGAHLPMYYVDGRSYHCMHSAFVTSLAPK